MRTIEEIMAAMQALLDGAEGRALTAEEVTNYEGMEAELATAQADQQVRARDRARRQPVAPGPAPAAHVVQPLPYNVHRVQASGGQAARTVFARNALGHDFSSDLFHVINTNGAPSEQLDRVNALITAAFRPTNDIDRADTDSLNPVPTRADLWQPQMDYATPLWDMTNSGPTDGTSFDVPKFNSASGMVGPATEGTEPTPGSFSVTDQTVTPTQVWGKVEITRQAARRGGRPELSGIIWDQMMREYMEDREAAIATFLNTLTAATDIALTGTPAATPDNDDDQQTTRDLEMAIADLQFARGGNRFRAFAVHQALYRVLARVEDDAGRPKYPIINPMNANGRTDSLYATINVGGTLAVPAYALGTPGTASVNSWLFDPAKLRAWADQPERLDWNFGATVQQISGATGNATQLAYVTIGIYGNVATACLDINGVRQVTFDPSV